MSSEPQQHQGNTHATVSLPAPTAAHFPRAVHDLGAQGVLSHALPSSPPVPADPSALSVTPSLLLAISRQAGVRESLVLKDGRRRVTRLFGIPAFGNLTLAHRLGRSHELGSLLQSSRWLRPQSNTLLLGSVFWAAGLEFLFAPQSLWAMADAAHSLESRMKAPVLDEGRELEWLSRDVHAQLGIPLTTTPQGSFLIVGVSTTWLKEDETDGFGVGASHLQEAWERTLSEASARLPGVGEGLVTLGAPELLGDAVVSATARQLVQGLAAVRHSQSPAQSQEAERPVEAGLFLATGATHAERSQLAIALRFQDGLTGSIGGLPPKLVAFGREILDAMERVYGMPSCWLSAKDLDAWAGREPAYPQNRFLARLPRLN